MVSLRDLAGVMGALASAPWTLLVRRQPSPQPCDAGQLAWPEGPEIEVEGSGATWSPVVGRVEWAVPASWSVDPASGHDFGLGPSHRIRARPDVPGADLLRTWARGRLDDVLHAAVLAAGGDAGASAHAVATVEDFTRRNPPGAGPHWATAMEVSLRAVRLLLAATRPGAPAPLRSACADALALHEAWLRSHADWRLHFTGNHYLVATAGRFLLSVVLPATPSRRREARRAWRHFWADFARQVGDDGLHFESSTHYHLLVAETAAAVAELGRVTGHALGPRGARRLDACAAATAQLQRPDGSVAAIGDSDDGRFLPSRLGPEPPDDAAHARDVARRIARVATPAACAAGQAWLGADGGLAVLSVHAARARVHVTVSATPRGRAGTGGHGHDDAGSYDLWLEGPLVSDRGTGSYTGDVALRETLRGVASHSVIQVDDLDQNPPVPGRPFRRVDRARPFVTGFQPGAGGRVALGHHGYFAEGVKASVLRTLTLLPTGELVVEDDVDGAGEHRVVLRVHLAPGVTSVSEGAGAFRLLREGAPVALLAVEALGGDGRARSLAVRTLPTPHSRRMGQVEDAWRIEVQALASLPLRVRHVLGPA